MRGLSRAGPVDKAADKPFLRQWFPWIWSHGFRRAACLGKSTGWYTLTSAMNCSWHTIRQLAVHLTALSGCSKRSCPDICMGSNRSGGWQRKFGSISPIADSVDSSWVTPSRITLPSAKPGGEKGGRAAPALSLCCFPEESRSASSRYAILGLDKWGKLCYHLSCMRMPYRSTA